MIEIGYERTTPSRGQKSFLSNDVKPLSALQLCRHRLYSRSLYYAKKLYYNVIEDRISINRPDRRSDQIACQVILLTNIVYIYTEAI